MEEDPGSAKHKRVARVTFLYSIMVTLNDGGHMTTGEQSVYAYLFRVAIVTHFQE